MRASYLMIIKREKHPLFIQYLTLKLKIGQQIADKANSAVLNHLSLFTC
jgi:hypothetical protein